MVTTAWRRVTARRMATGSVTQSRAVSATATLLVKTVIYTLATLSSSEELKVFL
jgi:hypothetical protein